MANLSSSSSSSSSDIINEPIGPLYTEYGRNIPYPSRYDKALANNLPNQSDSRLTTSSDLSQDRSTPTQPVSINMRISEQTNGSHFVRPSTTTDPFRSSSTTVPRNSHYRLSRHSSAANRYPYLSYNQRRSSARRSETLDAPLISERLSSNSRQDRRSTAINEIDNEYNEIEQDIEEDLRPSKSLWIVVRLIFLVLAIEFMDAVETALTVPILTSLHVDESYYSMAWLISPILGFFFQPVIGMWSDSCKCRWGRRRPFILAFSIGLYIGVVLLLNSSDLGILLGDSTDSETIPIRAVVLTAVGVTLLDFCADTANAPIRAYLIDTTNPSDQERGFNLHAILGGLGGGLGFSVGTVNWKHIPMFRKDGGEFSVIFYIATFLFIVCTISTLTSVREEPLGLLLPSHDNDDEQPAVEVDETRPLLSSSQKSSRLPEHSHKSIDSTNDRRTSDDQVVDRVSTVRISNCDSVVSTTRQTPEFDADRQQKDKLVTSSFMRRSTYIDKNDSDNNDKVTITSMIISMIRMPPRLWKLMICQVIGWIGHFATHLYFTDFVAVEIYNGTAEHGTDDPAFTRYKQGVTMGCWGLFVFSASSAIYAFCLERWLSNRFSLKVLYFTGYFIYVVGCLVNFFVHDIIVNIAMCFTFGILVVSLNTLPYQMLSQFHADPTYRNRDGSERGIGVDCSLLNSCHFLGELIVAAGLSPLLGKTGVNYCMVIAAAFTFIGNICMFFLFYFKN